MANNLPHNCFTEQLFAEPCLKCGSTEAVFVGHGTVRHCTRCVLSWGVGETSLDVNFAQPPIKKKISQMPPATKKAINTAIKDLDIAGGIDDRIKRLRGISNDEWQRAMDGEENGP